MVNAAPENLEGRSKDIIFDDLDDRELEVRKAVDHLVAMLRTTSQLKCFEQAQPEAFDDAFQLIGVAVSIANNAQTACGELSSALWSTRNVFHDMEDLKVVALDADLFWEMLQHAATPEKDHEWIQKAEEIREQLCEQSGDCLSALPYTEHWCGLVSRIAKEVHIRDLWSRSRSKVNATGMVTCGTDQDAQEVIPQGQQ